VLAGQQAPCGKEIIRLDPDSFQGSQTPHSSGLAEQVYMDGWGYSQTPWQSPPAPLDLGWASIRAGIGRVHPGMPTQHRGAVPMQPYQPRG
jgi:hypothetical protein